MSFVKCEIEKILFLHEPSNQNAKRAE